MTIGHQWTERTVLSLRGPDTAAFLQDLVTNDVSPAEEGALVYAALLTPQGKYLFDFFVFCEGDGWFLDVTADRAAALAQRLTLYRLRRDVAIAETDRPVFQVWETEIGLADPRHAALGRRVYHDIALDGPGPDWAALRVSHGIPETGMELLADDSYILEMGFEALAGVDFRKGCYVGQEVTARMKHKTELRKGLARVSVEGVADTGAEITADGKPVGTLHSVAGGEALAYLRFDRATGEMQAGSATLRLIGPV